MASKVSFRRELGLLDLTMASLGAIIGSGWLFGAMRGAQIAGPSAVISWIIGGVAVLLIGLVYAELGSMAPEIGALVRFPQYSHGTLVSLLMGNKILDAAYLLVGVYLVERRGGFCSGCGNGRFDPRSVSSILRAVTIEFLRTT